jgi:hypothetical protein
MSQLSLTNEEIMTHYLSPIVLKAMIAFYPMSNHTFHEPLATTQARYESIAEDIASGSDQNPIFEGEEGGVRTAFLLASIASFESGFIAKIDECKQSGDSGKAWTIFQLQTPYSPKGEVCGSRKKAVEWAIHHIRNSFSTCHSLPVESRLSAYTAGRCINGERKSSQRIHPAISFLNAHKQEVHDLMVWGF